MLPNCPLKCYKCVRIGHLAQPSLSVPVFQHAFYQSSRNPDLMLPFIPKTLILILSLRLRTCSTSNLLSLARSASTATRTMSSGSSQRQFQLRLDPLTGNSEWVIIDEEDKGGEIFQNSQQPVLAMTSYLDMLNDSRRNRAYREAIDKTITKPCHVLDIGYFYFRLINRS